MLTTLDHLVIAVADLAGAATTVSKLLGREPSWLGRHPAFGTANTLFRLDRTYVELLAAEDEGPIADEVRAHLAARGEGLFALAFGSDDLEAAVRELRARGLRPTDPFDGSGAETASGAVRRWRSALLPAAETRGARLFLIQHLSPPEALPPARPIGAAEGAIYGVDHVVIATADADAARALYGERLGIRLALDRTFEQWGARLLFFRVGGITLEVAASLSGAVPSGLPTASGDRDSFWGVSWQVSNLDLAVARLRRDGFDVSDIRTGRRPGTRVATVRAETHGVATLLIEPEKEKRP